MDFTPKPVYHNGNLFRSSTEYQWALVFEALHIHYLYELRSFDTEHGRYLPDFYLPNLKVWIEIKGMPPTDIELKKCQAVHSHTGEPVLVLSGRPGVNRFHEGVLPNGFTLFWVTEDQKVPALAFFPSDLYLLAKEVCGDPAKKLFARLVLGLIKSSSDDIDNADACRIDNLMEKYFRLIIQPFNYSEQKLVNTRKASDQAVTDSEKTLLRAVDTFLHARVSNGDIKRVVLPRFFPQKTG